MVLEFVELFINDILMSAEPFGKPLIGEKIIVELEPLAGLSNWSPDGKTLREATVPVT